MALLNYDVLKKSGYDGYILEDAPVKVLQFGEGNFLRAFVDYWFDLANEKAGWNGKCCLVQPIAPGLSKMINEQEGLYTLYLRGSENGQKVDDKRVISSVSRCLNPYEKAGYEAMMELAASDELEIIVSNTTEAGIQYDPSCTKDDCPPSSFPAKLTQVLYHRYQAGKKGIIMLACELIDNNGKELLKCVNQYIEQWGLEDGFKKYVNEDCTFCGSLVDRIVPGRIRDEKEVAELEQKHGYTDPLLDVGEVFGVAFADGDALQRRAAGEDVAVAVDVAGLNRQVDGFESGAAVERLVLKAQFSACIFRKGYRGQTCAAGKSRTADCLHAAGNADGSQSGAAVQGVEINGRIALRDCHRSDCCVAFEGAAQNRNGLLLVVDGNRGGQGHIGFAPLVADDGGSIILIIAGTAIADGEGSLFGGNFRGGGGSFDAAQQDDRQGKAGRHHEKLLEALFKCGFLHHFLLSDPGDGRDI